MDELNVSAIEPLGPKVYPYMDPNGLLQSKNPPKKPNMNSSQANKAYGDEFDKLNEQ